MRPLLLSLLVMVVAIASPAPVRPEYDNRIIFIRHAEKGYVPDPATGTVANETHLHHQHADGNGNAIENGVDQHVFQRENGHGNGDWPPPPPDHPRGPGSPGERPPRRKFPSGLNDKGRKRAQFLRTLFGNKTEYDIGLIFAAPRDEEVKETERTYATVMPLAQDLDLEINTECAMEGWPFECVVRHVQAFAATSDKDILISWKHRNLNEIATALGAPNAKKTYPDERNDIIWIMQGGEIVEKRSQHCPGLDDGRVDEGDPDLEVERA